MNPIEMTVRDAGPLDVEEETFAFEDEYDVAGAFEACLQDPFPTATTRVACD